MAAGPFVHQSAERLYLGERVLISRPEAPIDAGEVVVGLGQAHHSKAIGADELWRLAYLPLVIRY